MLNDETPIDARTSFPDGVTLLYAVFPYSGLKDGQTWKREWTRDGQAVPNLSRESTWSGGESGVWWTSINDEDGIPTGNWQYNLYLEGKLVQSAKFTVEKNPSGQPDFGPITFAPDKDANDNPLDAVDIDAPLLPSDTNQIYAFFDGIDVPKGTKYSSQWYRNGEVYGSVGNYTWDDVPDGTTWLRLYTTSGNPFTAGVYELRLSIGTRLVVLAVVTVEK